MADYPLDELDGKTCVEAAMTPNLDYVSSHGQLGTAQTVPTGYSPGSDVAAMSIFGCDPARFYTGRAPIEAASLKIDLPDDTIAFRCNLVTIKDNILDDYSSGHITNEEAKTLITCIDKELGNESLIFYMGNSYRHILTCKNSDSPFTAACHAPHDIMGEKIEGKMPEGEGMELLAKLMNGSRQILGDHQINKHRVNEGKNPANMIWLWGQGKRPTTPSFHDKFGAKAAVISAVDLLKGLAFLMDMDVIDVPGITGNIDTDYDAKAKYGIEALETRDLIVIHIEAPDEMGHCGNIKEKVAAIENIDEKIIGPMLQHLAKSGRSRILLMPDHYTPIVKRTHTNDPVPFAMFGHGIERGRELAFSEANAIESKLKVEHGHELMSMFLQDLG